MPSPEDARIDDEAAREELARVRDETRFELGLLHTRVNALVAAEAFLTISFTMAVVASGSGTATAVALVLCVLGLALALVAWPGVATTSRIVTLWTTRQVELVTNHPVLSDAALGVAPAPDSSGGARRDQRRGMLFFRAVPPVFAAVWVVLAVVAILAA